MKKSILKQFSYIVEYILFKLIFSFFLVLGIDKASAISGFILKKIGSYFKANRYIIRNLTHIYPNLPLIKQKKISAQVWENFGRYIGEFPHISKLSDYEFAERVEIEGLEHLQEFAKQQQPIIIFAGHFANWDLALKIPIQIFDNITVFYRKVNNFLIDAEVRKFRKFGKVNLISKGPESGRDLISAIKRRDTMVMLVDQKMNEGIKVPFLGRPAMTPAAIAVIARQYNYPLVPAEVIRKEGAYFKVIIHPSFMAKKTNNKEADLHDTMLKINNYYADWINKDPGQWFWLHQRWGKAHEMIR